MPAKDNSNWKVNCLAKMLENQNRNYNNNNSTTLSDSDQR